MKTTIIKMGEDKNWVESKEPQKESTDRSCASKAFPLWPKYQYQFAKSFMADIFQQIPTGLLKPTLNQLFDGSLLQLKRFFIWWLMHYINLHVLTIKKRHKPWKWRKIQASSNEQNQCISHQTQKNAKILNIFDKSPWSQKLQKGKGCLGWL